MKKIFTYYLSCAFSLCFVLAGHTKISAECHAAFTSTQAQNSLSVAFTNQATSSFEITSYLWSFGDNHTSDNANPTHVYAQAGTYEVCLTIHDNHDCTNTICQNVVIVAVSQNCEAYFGYFQTPNTLSIHFLDSSFSAHTITTWHWNFGDNHDSNDHTPTHTYTQPGTYEVCLTIHDNADCNDTYCHNILVQQIASGDCAASFEYAQTPNTLSIHFEDGSESDHDIISWLWTFGDGGTSDNHAPTHIYDQPGTYEVCLTIHDNTGCTDTYCHAVIVSPVVPGDCDAFFGWHQGAGTQTVHFIDSSFSNHDIVSYFWVFGDGHNGDGQNPNHYYIPGTYEVCLTITDNTGCTDSYCTTITVVPENQGGCQAFFVWHQAEGSLNTFFMDSSFSEHDIISYLWNFGDGHTSEEDNPDHTYGEPGTYQVCLTIHDNSGCSDTYCISVVINPVGPGECESFFIWIQDSLSLNVHFFEQAESNHTITSYLWNFGDGHNGDGHDPHHVYEHPGTYEVCLTIHDNSDCNDTYCTTITVDSVNTEGCNAFFIANQSENTLAVHFNNESSSAHDITSYSWNFGDGHAGDGQDPNHTYAEPGTYLVCLTIHDETGCTDTYCQEVTVTEVPPGDCEAFFYYYQEENNLTIHFIDSSSSSHDITTWTWDFGDGHVSHDHFITHTYSQPGTYEVCLTIHDNHDCNDTYCTVIVVEQVAQGDCAAHFISQQQENSLTVNFTDTSTSPGSIVSWLWHFGDGGVSDNFHPHHTYDHPGTYQVCLTIHDNAGCESTTCHEVVVLGNNSEQCHAAFSTSVDTAGLTVTFTNTSINTTPNTTYLWHFGDGGSSDDENPVHTYSHHDNYTICLIITDTTTDCSSDVCHVLHVFQQGGIQNGGLSSDVNNMPKEKSPKSGGHTSENFISVYPNPSSITATIEYELDEAAVVTIDLCDLYGNHLRHVTNAMESIGLQKHTMDCTNLNPGIYVFRIRVNQDILMKKIIIAR